MAHHRHPRNGEPAWFLNDLAHDQRNGQLDLSSVQSALDLIQGAVITSVCTMLVDKQHRLINVDDVLTSIPRGLGVPAPKAGALCTKGSAIYRASAATLS